MQPKELLKTGCASVMTAALLLQPLAATAEEAKAVSAAVPAKVVEIAPKSSDEVARKIVRVEDEPALNDAEKLALLQKNIKYVFVLFQENRSFDFYFGTYPGANGLFTKPAAETPGFNQPIVNTDGSVSLISPFNIPQSVTAAGGATVLLYPEDIDSVNHGQAAIDAKLDLNAENVAQNDRYAFVEEGLSGTLSWDSSTAKYSYTGPAPSEAQKQKGELVVSHVDCDTAPFLWMYADRFTLFDHFFDTVIGPSTPNAIAMIAGQSGETQWVKYPALGNNINTTGAALPMTGDPQPFWGSALDVFTPAGSKQPTEKGVPSSTVTNPASNLTFASLPLSFMGNQIQSITANDLTLRLIWWMCKAISRRLPEARICRSTGAGMRKDTITNRPIPPRRLRTPLTLPTTMRRSTLATRPTTRSRPARTCRAWVTSSLRSRPMRCHRRVSSMCAAATATWTA